MAAAITEDISLNADIPAPAAATSAFYLDTFTSAAGAAASPLSSPGSEVSTTAITNIPAANSNAVTLSSSSSTTLNTSSPVSSTVSEVSNTAITNIPAASGNTVILSSSSSITSNTQQSSSNTTPTSVSSTVPSSSLSKPSSSPGITPSVKIGIGLGVPLGVLIVALIAYLTYRYIRRRRTKQSEDHVIRDSQPDMQYAETNFEGRLMDKPIPIDHESLQQPKHEYYGGPSNIAEDMDPKGLPPYSGELEGSSRVHREELP